MEDLKKKINFDPSLLYYSPTSKDTEDDEKSPVTNVETYNSTNRKHVCTVCGKRFFSISALNVHMEHHPPNERSNVEKDDDNANSNRKNQYVWDNGIKCNKLECNFIALDAVEYSKHISSCEGTRLTKAGENISFCELCDSYFSSDNHFKAHLILQHPDCDSDISLKEYDAKYTTVSDPVSLYVSENSENDSDVKQAKNFSHSKYPDSSISKRKSKETENEEVSQKNQDINKTMDEVTVVTCSKEANSVKIDVNELVVDIVEKSSEVSVFEMSTNDKPHVEIENGKCDDEGSEEVTIQSRIEKSTSEQQDVLILNQNDTNVDSNIKDDSLVPANSENTSISNEISSKEKSNEDQTAANNKSFSGIPEVKTSDDMNVETKNEGSSEKLIDGDVYDTEVPQIVSENEKVEDDSVETDSKKVEAKDNDKQENYMNVEKMMYNLFKDEGTEATSSQERGDIQDLNDGSPEKLNEGNEQNQSSNPLDSNKDESDFEDFDYSKAGKKKYLKSYSRLNKSKANTNEEGKANETVEIKEEAETNEESQSIGLDKEVPKKKKSVGRKRKQSSISETPVADLNIKERSTRTRKKLILPDFEYDSDYKSYTPDAPSRRSETPKRPSLPKDNDSSPRKRGRPRKNQDSTLNSSDVDRSANITDMSTGSANKSTASVKNRIENSYLNASETSMKHDIADIKIRNSDSFNAANSSVSESFSQDETTEVEKKPKLQDTTKDTSELETVQKKKRGRPKSKTESELKQSKLPPTSSTMDKSTEESICSDVANALLSLSDSVPRKEAVVRKSTPGLISEKIDQVHIIKRKKMKTVKPVVSNASRKDDLENISTFELKNDLDGDLGDVSGEIDSDLSFNDANKFEKEKESEEKATNFIKDLSSKADVSTPKKRGRPPKVRKGPKPNALSQKTPVSGAQVPTKPKLSKSLPIDGGKRMEKIFDAASSDRKSVFLKNKAKMKNEFRKELISTLPIAKKKGRPSKSLSDTSTTQSPLLTNQPIKSKVKKQAIIPHGARPIHDIRIDEPDAPKPIKEKPAVKVAGLKKKKKKLGRPPKSASTNTSLQKEDTSKTSEKDLNLNELTSSRRARENSPFIYESYHPKKKRARLDIDNQDAEKNTSDLNTNENVAPKKVPRIPKPKKPPPPPPVEEPDETRNIDEELYLEDVKNRTKYGKLFRKAKSFVYDEKYTDDMIINCGRCKKKMTFRHYKNYHQLSHYYVSWIEGDQEINLQDDSDVVRHLQSAITPEALKKKAIRLACEKCNDVRKSVVGYVSHVRFCQKEDKNSLFETCKLCGKALRPSSVRFHYIKFHGCYKPSKGGMCFPDETDFFDNSQDFSKDDSDGTGTPLKKRFRMGFSRKELQKNDIVEDEEFWTELKTSCDLFMCMGLSCRHMAISKEELKAHVLECLSRFCEFSCSSCTYKTKYENEIIYHSKRKCQGETNDISIETLQSNRVTTRGKTLNFKFANDLNDASDDEKKRTDRTDGDFEVGDDKTDDEEFEDSDMEFEKSSLRKASKRKKTERSLLSTSVSDKLGLRNAFQQYCMGRADPLRWTVDLRLKLFSSTPLHVHMKVSSKEWDPLPPSDVEKYIPVHTKSVKVYFDGGSSSQFDLFQADVIKGVPLCYVGGPVWAMAWAPIPAHVTEQYLAVSTLQHMNHLVEINESVSFPSLIQFWKFSSIDNISNDIQKPILGWSIAHSYGAIWSMEWCPSGGFNNLSTTTRLGILAAATSSGCVVIYNIPKLEAGDKEPKEMVANPKPDLILKIRNDNVQCTRIVWDQMSPHYSLIGGFSDGSIAFWNINTASVLLKKGNVIYPYRTFEAHNSPITALDLHWLNNSRYLLTGSMNRVTRHWDLTDLSGPINEYERPTPVMNAVWMQHWIVTANVHDFGNLVGESGAFIAHPRDPFEKKKTVMNIKDAFWSLSYSLWNDTVAVSSNGGYVSAYAAKHLSMLTYKSPDFEKTITSTELVDLNDEEKKNFNSEELTGKMPSTNDLLDCTTIIKNNGIRFSDRAKNNMNNETLSFDVEKCSPTSVNKVCWNQNYNSFNWLAIGYECGFIRVIRVERFDKHYLTKFYKTNENTATLM